ncbi:Ail/Lom family outer membrane beta-barrel protein [Escherichia coli]
MKISGFIAGFYFTGMSFFPVMSWAAKGEHTLSQGYVWLHVSGLKNFVKNRSDYNRMALEQVVNDGFHSRENDNGGFSNYVGNDKPLQGINVRYRYEITDKLGVMSSFTWVRSKTSAKSIADIHPAGAGEATSHVSARTDIIASYRSFLAGPVWRVNEYASLYAMAGAGMTKFSADLKISKNIKGSKCEPLGDKRYSKSKISFAGAVGGQFNLNETVVIDVTYEYSGYGQWHASGFCAGIGFKF